MSAVPLRGVLVGVLLVFGAGMLAGKWLSRPPEHVEVQTFKVPVPVECREPVPARPAMPLEALRARPGPVDLDQFTQASIAELARREGYEIKLLAALNACLKPVAK